VFIGQYNNLMAAHTGGVVSGLRGKTLTLVC